MTRHFSPGSRRISRSALTIIGLATILGACGGRSEPIESDFQATATTTKVPIFEQAALDAYRASWADFVAVGDPIEPFSPRLSEHMADEQLQQVQSAFLARKNAGQVFRGDVDFAPKLVSITADEAVVSDCYHDRTQVFDAATGAPQGMVDTERQLVEAKLAIRYGSWKVVTMDHKGSGCAAGQ
jgi:hypothetical protein